MSNIERHFEFMKNDLGPIERVLGRTVLLLLISGITFQPASAESSRTSDSPAIKECILQAKTYLDEKKPTQISEHCYADYLAAISPNALQKTEDGQFRGFGFRNILFIQITSPTILPKEIDLKDTLPKTEKRIIAGTHSHLNEITALTLDNQNQDIIVLDGLHGLAHPFSLKFFGNVSPRRTLKNKLLMGATDIEVDPIHNELIFANDMRKSIQFFSRLADVDGHKLHNTTEQLRSIEGALTQITNAQSIALAGEQDELFLLDKTSNQFLVFDRMASGNIPPKRVVKGNATYLSNPVRITYNKLNDTLEILNGDGNTLYFARAASGDIAPLNLSPPQ